MRSTNAARHIAKGQPIRHDREREHGQYLVTKGEVVILRNRRPLDLVECDEVLDMMLWPNSTVMALFLTLRSIQPVNFISFNPDNFVVPPADWHPSYPYQPGDGLSSPQRV